MQRREDAEVDGGTGRRRQQEQNDSSTTNSRTVHAHRQQYTVRAGIRATIDGDEEAATTPNPTTNSQTFPPPGRICPVQIDVPDGERRRAVLAGKNKLRHLIAENADEENGLSVCAP